jgi:hypothetical protein
MAVKKSTKKPCTCGGTKRPGGQRCEECWLRAQPAATREAAARLRAVAVPAALHVARVPASAWPDGRRWCSGCQTFALLKDVGSGASKCKTCAGVVAHASMVERTYRIRDSETGLERPFTAQDYDRLLVLQGGVCATCRQPSKTKRLAIDHDHGTGLVRGLLCPGEYGCNLTVMGKIDKDPDPLAMALRIVDYYKAPPAGRI